MAVPEKRVSEQTSGAEDLPRAAVHRISGVKILATNASEANALKQAVTENPDIDPYSPPNPNESTEGK